MQDLKFNPDGSIDLYVGAKAPPGFEQNPMKTLGNATAGSSISACTPRCNPSSTRLSPCRTL
jgi:hypothetical protein